MVPLLTLVETVGNGLATSQVTGSAVTSGGGRWCWQVLGGGSLGSGGSGGGGDGVNQYNLHQVIRNS
jgi:hypothetical protein